MFKPTIALGRILFSSVVMVLAFRPGVPGSNPVESYISATHLLISFFVTDFVRKIVKSETTLFIEHFFLNSNWRLND